MQVVMYNGKYYKLLHFRNAINIVWFGARELGHPCCCNILVLITGLEIPQLRRWILKVERGNGIITNHTDNRNTNVVLLICVSWLPCRTTVSEEKAAAALLVIITFTPIFCRFLSLSYQQHTSNLSKLRLHESSDIWRLMMNCDKLHAQKVLTI